MQLTKEEQKLFDNALRDNKNHVKEIITGAAILCLVAAGYFALKEFLASTNDSKLSEQLFTVAVVFYGVRQLIINWETAASLIRKLAAKG